MSFMSFLDFLGGNSSGSSSTPGAPGSMGPNSLTDAGAQNPSTMLQGVQSLGGAAAPAAGSGLGLNLGTAQLAAQGIGALGQAWTSSQALGLAKKQFDFQRQFATRNLGNQIQSYNTALADRITSRGVAEGRSPDDVAAYIARNSLAR